MDRSVYLLLTEAELIECKSHIREIKGIVIRKLKEENKYRIDFEKKHTKLVTSICTLFNVVEH